MPYLQGGMNRDAQRMLKCVKMKAEVHCFIVVVYGSNNWWCKTQRDDLVSVNFSCHRRTVLHST